MGGEVAGAGRGDVRGRSDGFERWLSAQRFDVPGTRAAFERAFDAALSGLAVEIGATHE